MEPFEKMEHIEMLNILPISLQKPRVDVHFGYISFARQQLLQKPMS